MLGCMALIVLAFAGCGALAVFGDDSPDPRVDSKTWCQQYVKDRLKSPSSADFSGEVATQSTGDEATYTVTGAVDAQNSFGAKIRNTFTCTVRRNGKSWDLVSLTGLGN